MKEIQTFEFIWLSIMPNMHLQFNATEWGILIIHDVDHKVCAAIDYFFPQLNYHYFSFGFACSPPVQSCVESPHP